MDKNFDPDLAAYYASRNVPYLHIVIPGRQDMRLRMDREPCQLDANTELADCKATGKPPARWVTSEIDGKIKTSPCPSGPPEQCLYVWRMQGKEIIEMAKSLEDDGAAGVGAAATAAGAVAGAVSNQPKPAPQHVSNCVSLDPEAVLYGGFRNSCPYKVYVSYCALHPQKDAWNELFDCEKQKGGMDDIAANGKKAAHTNGTYMYWFACPAPSWPVNGRFIPGQGIVARCG